MDKVKVGILGATGLVGQKLVQLLLKHPWFELELLTASGKVVGKKYGEIVKWLQGPFTPLELNELIVKNTDLDVVRESKVELVFSALPSNDALSIEVELAKRGVIVISSSDAMKFEEDIPLLNLEVNADHVELIKLQYRRGWRGALLKIPNCTAVILTLALKPIMDEFGLKKVIVSTMQSISGAGLTGVPSIDIIDNIIPYIEGEEERVEKESVKILGSLESQAVKPADIAISASCHRVPVIEGHLEAIFIETIEEPSVERALEALEEFKGNKIRALNLPTAPEKPIIVRRELDRPQPRLDRYINDGMSVVIGRLRVDKALRGLKLIALGNNLIRGTVGTGILIAELLTVKGFYL
ncbi:MAG: aspartate-semialdehyde dehydrogenase [Desulfurococcaceae archaeon]|nr:aspartate-semialdehyde dehydrogenase [Sulfolobales archaeon]MDW8169996.1 aspartate-semialdehyde dehydrogenase [Desulfurococcaceae archaeon]